MLDVSNKDVKDWYRRMKLSRGMDEKGSEVYRWKRKRERKLAREKDPTNLYTKPTGSDDRQLRQETFLSET